MPRRSEETDIILELAEEVRAVQMEVMEQRRPTPPLMTESYQKSEYRAKWFRPGNQAFRDQELATRSQEEIDSLLLE